MNMKKLISALLALFLLLSCLPACRGGGNVYGL